MISRCLSLYVTLLLSLVCLRPSALYAQQSDVLPLLVKQVEDAEQQ